MFLSGQVIEEPAKDDPQRKKQQEQARKEGKLHNFTGDIEALLEGKGH